MKTQQATIFGYKQLGGHRAIDVALRTMRTSPDVFWTERANSYVLVQDDDGRAPWMHNGTPVYCYSVNGIGEVRWNLTPRDVYEYEDLATPKQFPTDREMMGVVEHFGLEVRR